MNLKLNKCSLSLTMRQVQKFHVLVYDGATTRDFQQFGIMTSVDSDEPVQSPVRLRNSKLRSFSSFTVIEYSSY